MENNFQANNKLEKLLKSIDSIQKIDPPPFFYTRLVAQINKKENIWERRSDFILRPVIVFACICLLIIMNIAAVYYNKHPFVLTASQNELIQQDEYNPLATNFYDLENTKP